MPKRPQATEQSDELVVPRKSGNAVVTPADSAEGRSEANGKLVQGDADRAQKRESVFTRLERVGEKAKRDKETKFTNLLTLIRVPLLEEAYHRLRKNAATGVDGVTWQQYGEGLETRLQDLEGRIHRGSYRALPVRRVKIPKGDGRTRNLGIPALEDKIVQQAVKMILEPIYEPMFLGFSYGFRPGRSQHDALDALAVALGRRVSWVLDADIRSFFDTIDHEQMRRFIEHRIGDRRLVWLLMKWLHAGVMTEEGLEAVTEGTPQGGVISPLLANIYLHYALDLWVQQWRTKHAHGEVYIVRYCDDFVMCFQFEGEARAMRRQLDERLKKFSLALHDEKTRVIRFGRFALNDCKRDGRTRPETFDFLGFTHIEGRSRSGKAMLLRRTSRKKRIAKLRVLLPEIRRRRHRPVHEQQRWLSSVLLGHYRYYGVPDNLRALQSYFSRVESQWHRTLQRRSQRGSWTAAQRAQFKKKRPLPLPRICHPRPLERFHLR
ncbi:MAG: group II intron reverse transcriptase/maturase [Planctomycetota bacterium]